MCVGVCVYAVPCYICSYICMNIYNICSYMMYSGTTWFQIVKTGHSSGIYLCVCVCVCVCVFYVFVFVCVCVCVFYEFVFVCMCMLARNINIHMHSYL